jgi:hypothetical protein
VACCAVPQNSFKCLNQHASWLTFAACRCSVAAACVLLMLLPCALRLAVAARARAHTTLR